MTKKSSYNLTQKLDALYEFERAPVTEDRLQPPSYCAGLFAGEHVAATLVYFVSGVVWMRESEKRRRSAGE